MTNLHSVAGVATLLAGGRALIHAMADQTSDLDWQQQQRNDNDNEFYEQMPQQIMTDAWGVPATQQPDQRLQPQLQQQPQQQQQIYGMSAVHRTLYPNASPTYPPYLNSTTSAPPYPPDPNWLAPMDTSTSPPFSPYPQGQHRLPTQPQQPTRPASSTTRPQLTGRAATAPAKSTRPPKPPAPVSSDSEEDFVTSSELGLPVAVTTPLVSPTASAFAARATNPAANLRSNSGGNVGAGRKRPRIPHTAVERRYRENLNAHLERLRQAVPSLASPGNALSAAHAPNPSLPGSNPTGTAPGSGFGPSTGTGVGIGTGIGESARPSKCEILNGAIEHIGTMERENAVLRGECEGLRRRVREVEGWYCGSGVGGGFG